MAAFGVASVANAVAKHFLLGVSDEQTLQAPPRRARRSYDAFDRRTSATALWDGRRTRCTERRAGGGHRENRLRRPHRGWREAEEIAHKSAPPSAARRQVAVSALLFQRQDVRDALG